MAALAKLDALLSNFPFIDDVSRSVALSALITPVVRGAMTVAPMHAISGTAPGSGKSYIVELASAISGGERAPVISAGKTEEETEKRLVGATIEGHPLITVDNVNGALSRVNPPQERGANPSPKAILAECGEAAIGPPRRPRRCSTAKRRA